MGGLWFLFNKTQSLNICCHVFALLHRRNILTVLKNSRDFMLKKK